MRISIASCIDAEGLGFSASIIIFGVVGRRDAGTGVIQVSRYRMFVGGPDVAQLFGSPRTRPD